MDAGIQNAPCKHKDRKNEYCDFQLRQKWSTNINLVNDTILSRPLRDRCNCQCQAKIVEIPVQTILYISESCNVLEALPQKWSNMHLFKCNYPECFKSALCAHVLVAGMMCDPSIGVWSNNLGLTLQRRCARGRPSTKGSEMGGAGEARACACIALQTEYRAPKVLSQVSLFC